MKLIKQATSLEIDNLDVEKRNNLTRHSILLPNSIRCLICGPSNCGKTNVMITLLLHRNGLKFANVYLYSNTIFQPKYCFLNEVFKNIPTMQFYMFNKNNDVIPQEEALPNSIFIFDDIVCENQMQIRNYFSMGRHKKIDCFYLSQTYSKIPKQLIRDNSNLLIIFKQDDVNLKHIFNEHVNSDIEWLQFKKLCIDLWKDKHSFLVINKDCELNEGRYRRGFDKFIIFE